MNILYNDGISFGASKWIDSIDWWRIRSGFLASIVSARAGDHLDRETDTKQIAYESNLTILWSATQIGAQKERSESRTRSLLDPVTRDEIGSESRHLHACLPRNWHFHPHQLLHFRAPCTQLPLWRSPSHGGLHLLDSSAKNDTVTLPIEVVVQTPTPVEESIDTSDNDSIQIELHWDRHGNRISPILVRLEIRELRIQ